MKHFFISLICLASLSCEPDFNIVETHQVKFNITIEEFTDIPDYLYNDFFENYSDAFTNPNLFLPYLALGQVNFYRDVNGVSGTNISSEGGTVTKDVKYDACKDKGSSLRGAIVQINHGKAGTKMETVIHYRDEYNNYQLFRDESPYKPTKTISVENGGETVTFIFSYRTKTLKRYRINNLPLEEPKDYFVEWTSITSITIPKGDTRGEIDITIPSPQYMLPREECK